MMYRYTRNKDPLSTGVINKDQVFYIEDIPKFCSCQSYIRYSETLKNWYEVSVMDGGETIVKSSPHVCKFIPNTNGGMMI